MIGNFKRNMGYIFGFMSFIIMIITGFLPLILSEKVLSGWWMISHATVAPVFSIFLAVGALFWVKSTGFGFNNGSESKCAKKIVWVFLILFIPNTLSILFSMNTWFPSATQYSLLSIHFYTAIAMFVLAGLYLNFSHNKK